MPVDPTPPYVVIEPLTEESADELNVTAPPVPPLSPPEVLIELNESAPAFAVRETAPPLLLPDPAVLIAPETVMAGAINVKAPLPVMDELKESAPDPVCVKVIAPEKEAGPMKLAVVPCVVLLVPLKEIVAAVTESVPTEVGPRVNPGPEKVPPATNV